MTVKQVGVVQWLVLLWLIHPTSHHSYSTNDLVKGQGITKSIPGETRGLNLAKVISCKGVSVRHQVTEECLKGSEQEVLWSLHFTVKSLN